MAKTVQIYNLETKEISTIPASELAPGMVEADVQGVGRVWISASQARIFEGFQHGPFPEEVREILRKIKSVLDEVYPKSLEDWENGFRKDLYPEQEIALWLHIASIYEAFTEEGETSLEERREVLRLLIACSMSPREHLFEVFQCEKLLKATAEHIVGEYYSGHG